MTTIKIISIAIPPFGFELYPELEVWLGEGVGDGLGVDPFTKKSFRLISEASLALAFGENLIEIFAS